MMRAYADYKDSGVDWLGDIPAGWETAKLKFIASLYNGDSLNESQKKSYESDDTTVGYAYISSKDITAETSSIDYKNGLRITEEHTKFKLAPIAASLICIEGGSAGRKIAFTRERVCFVNKLACVRSKQCHNPKYTFYLLKSGPFQNQFYSAMTGLIGGVAISNIKNFELTLPPLPEQTAIAGFLDDKTAKIDELVGIKRRQIALLGERKQILIQNAVTKGLNPNAPLKDSGVDWIGNIPAHWEQVPNKHIFGLKKNLVGKRSSEYDLLSLTLRGIIKRDMENPEGKFPAEFDTYQEVNEGDFVFCLFDVEETPRTVGLSSFNGMITGAYTVYEPTIEISRRFLLHFYICADTDKKMRSLYKGLRNTISKDSFGAFKTPLPPLNEQEAIVDFIDEQSNKINAAITIKQNQITKLNEYKTTLINAAVTGKIKVA